MNLNDYLFHWDKALKGGVYEDIYAEYLALNRARFRRIYKTFKPSKEFQDVTRQITQKTNWIIITEPWCGDAAQSVPAILRLIEQIPFSTYTLELRDQSSLIHQYLTNGGKSIPKVIVRDEKGLDLFIWGPRPEDLQQRVKTLRETGVEQRELQEFIHKYYGRMKGHDVSAELATLMLQRITKS